MTAVQTIHRRGLTFIELMFATIILGVGMIIIASVFPVAISQQRETLDEGSVASLERSAVRTLEAAAAVKGTAARWLPDTAAITTAADPNDYTGSIESFANNATLWNRIKGDLINSGDPRYAFSPMFMRMREGAPVGPPDPYDDRVTFFVVTMASKETAAFDGSSDAELNRLKPSNVKITYYYKESTSQSYDSSKLAFDPEVDTIKIEAGNGTPNTIEAAVTGGYIVRANGVKPGTYGTPNPLFPQNAIIKLGAQFQGSELQDDTDTSCRIFRVAPGFELNAADAGVVNQAPAYAVGADPVGTLKTNKPNRAISCRAVTVKIPDPG